MLEDILSRMEEFFAGKPLERTEDEQRAVDEEAKKLSLYHFPSCLYCLRVRSVLKRLKLNIELRDIHRYPEYRDELVSYGGHSTVPCLRIQEDDGSVRWLYESPDINRLLEERFGPRRE